MSPLDRSALLIPVLGLFALFGNSDSALAANPNQHALDHFSTASHDLLKDFKTFTKSERKIIGIELDAIDARVKDQTADSGDVGDLFDAVVDRQVVMRDRIETVDADFAARLAESLLLLPDQGVDSSKWPRGFSYGDGGIADDFHGKFIQALADHYSALTTRCDETAALFEKKLGLGVCIRLSAPIYLLENVASAGESGTGFSANPRAIDVALSVRDLAVPGDGTVRIAGSGDPSDGQLNVQLLSLGISNYLGAVTPGSNHRWKMTLQSIPEGNHGFAVLLPFTSAGNAFVMLAVR